jgi:hypothetical protein
MAAKAAQEETPAPVTVAKGGRGSSGANDKNSTQNLQCGTALFEQFQKAVSAERMAAYTGEPGEGVTPECVAMARYLLNMALCDSLYAPLHFCEIGLRNAIHLELSRLTQRHDWYDCPSFELTLWAKTEVARTKQKIIEDHKQVTPDRAISKLNFGFWTSLFESHYEQRTDFLPTGIKGVFPYMPKKLHRRKERKADLEKIRQLRNNIFHHERIIHWKDLDSRHQQIHDVLGWLNPSLRHMAQAVDRFTDLRSAGLKPWINIVQGDGRGVGYGG